MVNLVNMSVSRERMEKYQNRHLRQMEHAAKQVEDGGGQDEEQQHAKSMASETK